MEKIIIDERLKSLYYQGNHRTFVAVDAGKSCSIYYSEHSESIDEARNYIINSPSLLNGKYHNQSIKVEKKSQIDIDDYFLEKNQRESDIQLNADEEDSVKSKILNVLQEGVNLGASDIHIEIYARETLIKVRVDGRRKQIRSIPENLEGMRMASVLFMKMAKDKETDYKSNKVNNGNLVTQLNVKGTRRVTNWRVGWIPAINEGGKITLRWTDRNVKPPTREELNWERNHIKQSDEFIEGRPGLFIMAGQTGSGKTTTICSMIDSIDKSYSVHTIEDPPEFELDGVIQTHTKPHEKVSKDSHEYLDQTYYAKSLLRHDPDYEFHGELRTAEAAKEVMRKGETGQKVFTTVHTSSPLGIPITFIEQWGMSPALVASPNLLRHLVYQVLVRQICPHCGLTLDEAMDSELLTDSEKTHLSSTINKLVDEDSLTNEQTNNFRFKNPKGCNECIEGEKERLPLVEMIVVNDVDREFIKSCDFLGWQKHLMANGYKTVRDHAIVRMKRGQVDLFTIEQKIGRLFEEDVSQINRSMLDD
ncbi:GspE/PulE family protein [Vibrio tubiashii]|uniref:Type II secretion protein n=1 Tax=Vibrio tubiashii ATCC 19109 TaxID=1051646 RepID=F9T6T3_9VIBR|nr:ATPase, T2SS/T4P/T4SS family [Vibrio tubiashii]AIW17497.1 type II secretion protein [Vibrio tubiashii ATCC 19109]EGU54488.1 putative Type II secretion protein [Vibrio tubiashii ATCC 19109]EIF05989.1 putative Type II secretion protein [Vibrio tubiashii NCIMB 1337 = ATCC 19106]